VSDPAGDREPGAPGDEERPPALVRRLRPTSRLTSGRERHEEKITVYVSSEELFALERARLVLRAEHGIAVDRGRMVREAVAELLVDLDTHGDESILVRRLHP
jgi:hypothetical protein